MPARRGRGFRVPRARPQRPASAEGPGRRSQAAFGQAASAIAVANAMIVTQRDADRLGDDRGVRDEQVGRPAASRRAGRADSSGPIGTDACGWTSQHRRTAGSAPSKASPDRTRTAALAAAGVITARPGEPEARGCAIPRAPPSSSPRGASGSAAALTVGGHARRQLVATDSGGSEVPVAPHAGACPRSNERCGRRDPAAEAMKRQRRGGLEERRRRPRARTADPRCASTTRRRSRDRGEGWSRSEGDGAGAEAVRAAAPGAERACREHDAPGTHPKPARTTQASPSPQRVDLAASRCAGPRAPRPRETRRRRGASGWRTRMQ
jgi:hypothetical protein